MITKRSLGLLFMLVMCIYIGHTGAFDRLSNRVSCWFRVEAQNEPPRFQLIDDQGFDQGFGKGFLEFQVLHDTQTGQEIVCVSGGAVYETGGCYLTGRKW